jgi:arylsulfatase A-like enzyme
MHVIFVLADSLRRDHVSVYGAPPWGPIHTPSLARFAESAAVFKRACIGSFPTVPNRRDTLLGRGDKGMPFNRWKGLDPDEPTFLKLLSAKGVPSLLPLARGESEAGRQAAVVGTGTWGGAGGLAQVLTDRWLYAVWRGERSCCLYDLEQDPLCTRDLAADRPEVVRDLHAEVIAHVRRQGLGDEFLAGYKP